MSFLLAVLSFLLPENGPALTPERTSLKVDVQNVRVHTGTVHVGLYRACSNFPDCQPVELKILDAKANNLQTSFSLEPGEYAVAIYHDENGNGQMDKRVFGIPKEPYGFSNNYRPRLSAPKFSDCKISVGNGGKVISIKLD